MKEGDFQRAMLKLYTQSREEVGYNATYFLRMIDEMGGLDAARQLINSPNESQGFTTLWEAGRLDLSVEALAIRPEWRDLFTPAEVERTVDRLRRYDYEVSSQAEQPTPLTIQWIIDELNRRAAGRPIGNLQQLRRQFKRLDRRPTAALFKSEPVEKDFAFHAGGRDELQFNVGFETRGGQRLVRHGVAFSLQPSQTVPEPMEVMLPKIGRYNAFLRDRPGSFEDLRFWLWAPDSGFGADTPVREIWPEEVVLGRFLFAGKRYPVDALDLDAILDDWDRLLPLYEVVENPSGQADSGTTVEVEFTPGHTVRRAEPQTLTRVEAELSVTYQHNRMQDKLYGSLVEKYGKDAVRTEWPCAPGVQVDVAVRVGEGELWFYEIKTAPSVRTCIRQALSQIMEYAYWPTAERAIRMVIVGLPPSDAESEEYLEMLRERFGVPVYYEQCEREQ